MSTYSLPLYLIMVMLLPQTQQGLQQLHPALLSSLFPLLLDCATIFRFLSIYSAWSGDARHQNNNFQATLLCLSTIFLACKVLRKK